MEAHIAPYVTMDPATYPQNELLPVSDEQPQTLAEYEYLINAVYHNGQVRYQQAMEQAKTEAAAQWDAEAPKKREQLIAQMEANLAAETIDTPDGPQGLSETEWKAKWNAGISEINAQLVQERQQYIEQAASMVQPPESHEQIETTYGFFKAAIEQAVQPESEAPVAVATYDAIWTDGERYWDVAEHCFVNPNSRMPIDESRVVMLANNGVSSFEQNIRENIALYSRTDSRIKLGPEIMTTEELFASLREERSKRLAEYDTKIAQLDRQIRENPDYAAYTIQRGEWDAYATALCNLPSQEGAPWDGGGPLTPWPECPA